MLREQKGITLVALVITIIVLLILAGVSISLVVGNNGVLTRASGAVVTNIATGIAEDIQLAFGTAEMEYQYAAAGRPGASRAPYYGTATTGADKGIVAQELDSGVMEILTDLESLGTTEDDTILFDDKGNPIVLTDNIDSDTYGSADDGSEATVPVVFADGRSYVVSYRENAAEASETYYFLLRVNGGATAEFIGYVPDDMVTPVDPDAGEEDPT